RHAGAAARQHLLQRDGAAELEIECLDDAAHAAPAELGAEPIALAGWNRSNRRGGIDRIDRRLGLHRVVASGGASRDAVTVTLLGRPLPHAARSVEIPVDVRDARVVADVDRARALVVRRAAAARALHRGDAVDAGEPGRLLGIAV